MPPYTPNESATSPDVQPTQSNSADIMLHSMQAVNEQLLLAGLREQALTAELRRQLAFTNTITASLGEAVMVLDSAGLCTFGNPAAEQMFGWRSADVYGKRLDVLLAVSAESGATSTGIYEVIRAVLGTGVTHRDDTIVFLHRDGTEVPVAYVAAPIVNDRHVSGVVITLRDMTDARRLAQLREEYVGLISHDLRAPLTAILGRAEILLRQLTQQGLLKEANSARVMVESSQRMNHMIQDLLNRSYADAPIATLQREAIDLVVLVQHMIEQTVAVTDRARITLDASAPLTMIVDIAKIERVVVNLLTNALKFSPAETMIDIGVTHDEQFAIVAVTDQGVGIAPEAVSHVFEKHYRAKAVGQIAGNGLGLYSSRLIVEEHGGQLLVESTPGRGSTFTVVLPLRQASAQAADSGL